MIVHFACDKGICTQAQCFVQQEIACPATDGHLSDGSAQQLVAHGTLYAKAFLNHQDEIVSSHRFRKTAHNTTTRFYIVHGLLGKERHVRKSQFLCYLPVDAVLGIVHVGVHGNDDDIVFDGFDDTTLHIVLSADLFQSAKQQGMVTHNEVAPLLNSLINNLFVDVQTQ